MKFFIKMILILMLTPGLAFGMEKDAAGLGTSDELMARSIGQEQSKQGKKKRRKRNKKKNNQNFQIQTVSPSSLPAAEASPLRVNAPLIEEKDFPRLLIGKEKIQNITDANNYLENIQKLLSALSLMEEIVPFLKEIRKQTESINSCLPQINSINVFGYIDEPCTIKYAECKGIFGSVVHYNKAKEDKCDWQHCIVQTSEGKAAIMQMDHFFSLLNNVAKKDKSFLQGDLNLQSKLAKGNKLINKALPGEKFENWADLLFSSNHIELKILGHFAKNIIATNQRMKAIRNLQDTAHTKIGELKEFMPVSAEGEYLINSNYEAHELVFKDWLGDRIFSFANEQISDFFNLFKTVFPLKKYTLERSGRSFSSEENQYVLTLVNQFLPQYEMNKAEYTRLYSLLLMEQEKFFKDTKNRNRLNQMKHYGHYIFAQNKTRFSKTLCDNDKQPAEISDFINSVKRFEENRKAKEKNQTKKIQNKKNQKQQHAMHKDKAEAHDDYEEKEKETESTQQDSVYVIEKPAYDIASAYKSSEIQVDLKDYDDRSLRWFNQEFRQNKTYRDLLYHSPPLAIDYFIKKCGKSEDWPNRTKPGQIDRRHYMGGEIHFPDASKKTVLFAITQDPKGIIYHRGFELKEKYGSLFEEFKNNQFEFDFPASFEDPVYNVKKLSYDFNNERVTQRYDESPFCIKIHDPLNKVSIVLFKSDFSN